MILIRFTGMSLLVPALFSRTISGRFLKAPQEMSLAELREEMEHPSVGFVASRWATIEESRAAAAKAPSSGGRFRAEYRLRLVASLACIAFAIVAVPLGLLIRPTGFAAGYGVALLLLFFYYGCVNAGIWLERSAHPAGLAVMALPNVALALGGALLMRVAARR